MCIPLLLTLVVLASCHPIGARCEDRSDKWSGRLREVKNNRIIETDSAKSGRGRLHV